MARRTPRRAGIALLVLCATVALSSCTAPGATAPASTSTTSTKPPPTDEVAVTCTDAQIRAAVARFFTTWNGRDRVAIGRLFETDGILDMATKFQDTVRDSAWSEAAGPSQIAAFAAQQWVLGETLSYNGMTIYPGGFGGGGGAEVDYVDARFADGSVQQIEEAKFNYDCARFTHVVIISLDAAKKP